MFTFPVAHFGGELAFTIDQAIRFNDNDSASLTRTPSSAGDRRTFTFSCWVKRANLTGANQPIFSAGGDDWLMFLSAETLGFNTSGSNYRIVTSQVFVDPGAWFHLVLRVDTTNSTAGDRLRLYINGSEVTDFGTDTNPTLNFDTAFNNTGEHRIGKLVGASQYFDGYLAEINHVDGSSLGPDSFGETNADTGQWVPVKYAGSYGTNGFRITGADSSDLGADQAGSNDFTSSGLASDQVTDSPTNNQATLNPLFSGVTLSDGNLVATASGNSYQRAFSTFAIDDGGKHVCEFQKSSGTFGLIGIMQNGNHTNTTGNSNMFGINLGNGEVFKGNPTASVLTTVTAPGNSLMRIEYDSNADTITIFDDGTEIFPASTGVSDTVGLTGHDSLHFGCAPYASGTIITATFSPLSGTPTTDFKELTTANLDDPTIADPKRYFGTLLYTGNGTTGQTVTGLEASDGTSWTPDWVWIKPRSAAYNSKLFDSVRTLGHSLESSTTNAEADLSAEFIAFADGGFQVDDNGGNNINQSGITHVAWNWEAGGSGSSNTDGSITSTVSANTTSGFSICTFTGNQTSGATFGHGLNTAPKMVWVKERSPAGNNWKVGHASVGFTKFLALDTTGAATTDSAHWNDTAPSSTVVTLGNDTGINQNTATYVAYCFAEVEGFSKFGHFEGNGSTDGPFIYTGFKPRWIMIKRYDSTESWPILDTARGSGNFGSDAGTSGSNPTAGNDLNAVLVASTSAAEEDNPTGSRRASYLSNGFKVRTTNTAMNASGGDYLYMAFAESPFKHATAR